MATIQLFITDEPLVLEKAVLQFMGEEQIVEKESEVQRCYYRIIKGSRIYMCLIGQARHSMAGRNR